MKTIKISAFIFSCVLTVGSVPAALMVVPAPANAQDYRFNPEHRRPVEATIRDLEEVVGRMAPRGEERHRFDSAIKHLTQFSDKLHEGGRFDKGLLDDGIGNVQNIVDHARLPEEPRQILSRDLTELRRLRQHYEDRKYIYR